MGYLIFMAPAILLGLWASHRVRTTFNAASRQPAPMTGYQAARTILDSSGLHNVQVEMVGGHLSDHYDPRNRVLRLSQPVYASNSMAAVGVAAHEAGHALQHAKNYTPLVIRNLAVPAANFGSGISWTLVFLGFLFSKWLILAGAIAFSFFVFFQIVNLPVEFDASRRAKHQLAELGLVSRQDQGPIRKVLNAAAMTYVAATLQSVATLAYFLLRMSRR